MFRSWEKFTYFGPVAEAKIALAREAAGEPFADSRNGRAVTCPQLAFAKARREGGQATRLPMRDAGRQHCRYLRQCRSSPDRGEHECFRALLVCCPASRFRVY